MKKLIVINTFTTNVIVWSKKNKKFAELNIGVTFWFPGASIL